MLLALDVKMDAIETLKVTHCSPKQCLSLYFAVVCQEEGAEAAPRWELLTFETEEEVKVPVALRCSLKVFLRGCSHSSHRC